VGSIAGGALERSPTCTQSQSVRSSAALSALNHSLCARAHVTALKTHGAAGEAMAARATRADETCA
jgi:hypothetical protein